jgi:hypothetical protein
VLARTAHLDGLQLGHRTPPELASEIGERAHFANRKVGTFAERGPTLRPLARPAGL